MVCTVKHTFYCITLIFLCISATNSILLEKHYNKDYKEGVSCLIRALKIMNMENPESDSKLSDIIREGITQTTDMLTVLLHYYQLKRQNKRLIDDCRLDLSRATDRCRKVYTSLGGSCDVVRIDNIKAPFVTITCPNGYIRYGCCKCMRKCNHVNFVENEEGQDHSWRMRCKKVKRITSNIIAHYQYID